MRRRRRSLKPHDAPDALNAAWSGARELLPVRRHSSRAPPRRLASACGAARRRAPCTSSRRACFRGSPRRGAPSRAAWPAPGPATDFAVAAPRRRAGDSGGLQELQGANRDRGVQPQAQLHRCAPRRLPVLTSRLCAEVLTRAAAAVGANGAGKTNFFHGASPCAHRALKRCACQAAAADAPRPGSAACSHPLRAVRPVQHHARGGPPVTAARAWPARGCRSGAPPPAPWLTVCAAFGVFAARRALRPQEGAGHAVMTAYVEIVFDNSDNRMPVRARRSRRPSAHAARFHPSRASPHALASPPAPPAGGQGRGSPAPHHRPEEG